MNIVSNTLQLHKAIHKGSALTHHGPGYLNSDTPLLQQEALAENTQAATFQACCCFESSRLLPYTTTSTSKREHEDPVGWPMTSPGTQSAQRAARPALGTCVLNPPAYCPHNVTITSCSGNILCRSYNFDTLYNMHTIAL
jgi:hypothetical protein